MAQTNIFRPLKQGRSNFFLFSQFGDDLTKEYTQKDSYRVVPSSFICVNLNIDNFVRNSANSNIEEANIKLVEILQNYYENFISCARADSSLDSGSVISSDGIKVAAKEKLWTTLQKFGLLSSLKVDTTTSSTLATLKEVVYKGDINIYSSDTADDGVAYNEIYCVIPSEGQKTVYQFQADNCFDLSSGANNEITITNSAKTSSNKDYIWGWDDTRAFDTELSYEAIYDGYDVNDNGYYDGSGFAFDKDETKEIDTSTNKFSFNTIIVLYDIVNPSNSTTIQKDIPMGIYFTGSIEKNTDSGKYQLSNTITKYSTTDSESIYGEGTAYTLRIATRYLTTQNATEFQSTTVDVTSLYPEYSAVMQSMADTISEFEDVVDSNNNIYNALIKHLALFKNSTVNVPYILKTKTGEYNWFVNGKDTGVPAQYTINTTGMLVPRNNERSLYIRTNAMSNAIEAGEADAKELYIFDYDDDTRETTVKNIKISGSCKIGTLELQNYIKKYQYVNASNLEFNITNTSIGNSLKTLLTSSATETEQANGKMTLEKALSIIGNQISNNSIQLNNTELKAEGKNVITKVTLENTDLGLSVGGQTTNIASLVNGINVDSFNATTVTSKTVYVENTNISTPAENVLDKLTQVDVNYTTSDGYNVNYDSLKSNFSSICKDDSYINLKQFSFILLKAIQELDAKINNQ